MNEIRELSAGTQDCQHRFTFTKIPNNKGASWQQYTCKECGKAVGGPVTDTASHTINYNVTVPMYGGICILEFPGRAEGGAA